MMSLMACSNGKKVAPFSSLEGEWIIVEVNNQGVTAENEPFLGFDIAEMRLYGNAGCNHVMGALETNPEQAGTLSFGSLGSTKRMCADMLAEDAILQALGNVKGYDLQEDKLVLTDETGKELFELKKK